MIWPGLLPTLLATVTAALGARYVPPQAPPPLKFTDVASGKFHRIPGCWLIVLSAACFHVPPCFSHIFAALPLPIVTEVPETLISVVEPLGVSMLTPCEDDSCAAVMLKTLRSGFVPVRTSVLFSPPELLIAAVPVCAAAAQAVDLARRSVNAAAKSIGLDPT